MDYNDELQKHSDLLERSMAELERGILKYGFICSLCIGVLGTLITWMICR